MKKVSLLMMLAIGFVSCNSEETTSGTELQAPIAERKCSTMDVLDEQLKADPSLQTRMNEIETFTETAISQGKLVNGKIVIPVVVNVLYRTTAENISLAQIQSQIDVLNEDFNATNSDWGSVPALFAGVKANVGISFELDQVIRKQTTATSWTSNDAVKKTAQGGLNPTSPTTKLNIWVCTLSGGLMGYAQFPGGSSSTDGVVLYNRAFGRTGTATAPFNKGRITTHEVGHWMNLRHIWGDTTCGNDFVADTPTHNAPNNGVPGYPHYSTCSGNPVEMTMNYMDYVDNAAMYMFSNGQKSRMLAIFASGGPRYSFAQ
ncbi:zinc metalloprotease [Flavobacterium sp. '19STA2R22 D10 B1']|uniref:zinc metalloprotease n=1 Tax=Flavobacterium aerium TaxID=3037261 RepID=UPI00278C2311|nr:zinc metalloprotease [Flavobacterium sp. '19STA2R22 D10 B1']